MNELEFAQGILQKYYEAPEVIRKTSTSSITRYHHISSGKNLIVIESQNANDGVYQALLNHSNANLPKIFGVYSAPEKMMVFEEFLEGETLESYMHTKKIESKDAIHFCDMLCDAVSFLHEKNIIHRDIKPSNIMICDGVLKLIDFSIARLLRPGMKSDTTPLGSIGYAAPEQFGLIQSNPATDIYAIGVLLNELLTGKHPTEQIASGNAGKIISKCLHIQASRRYQSIAQLKKAISKLHYR